MIASDTILFLRKLRLPLDNEKYLQSEMEKAFIKEYGQENFIREHELDGKNIIDFFLFDSIGIEVKIKGSKVAIYKQCVRYLQFNSVKELILVTNKAIGFPAIINNKNCYILNLGKAWL